MNPELILLLERWLVVPIVAGMVGHGLVGAENTDTLVKAFDNILASLFLVVYFLFKHRVKPSPDSTVKPTLFSVWLSKIKTWFIDSKKVESVPETPQQ